MASVLSSFVTVDWLTPLYASLCPGGAARVELCANLVDGGTTPSWGMLTVLRKRTPQQLDINVIIRPRGGDFAYSEAEFAVMVKDIESAKDAGASGVVLGVLSPDGAVDVPRTKNLVEIANPMSVTFHRAFDVTRDPNEALEACIECGCDRILTSGMASSAMEGAPVIKRLVAAAKGRIVIMAGAGITVENVTEVLVATGVDEVHASGRSQREGLMEYRPDRVIYMGAEKVNEPEVEYCVKEVTAKKVNSYMEAIKKGYLVAKTLKLDGDAQHRSRSPP